MVTDYFQHILDFILQARKSFRPQNDDETILADKTDFVWETDWSHVLFFNIPIDVSSATIATISVHRD